MMVKKKENGRLLLVLGSIALLYWIFDFINIVFFLHDSLWLLWYSSAGLLLTAVALLTRNKKLISSAFCALFVIESVWIIDFFLMLFFKVYLFGFTSYAFSPNFSQKDFFMTFYHVLIPLFLFIGIRKTPGVDQSGWMGASVFALCLALLTYFLSNPHDRVNCLYPVDSCQTNLSFMYSLSVLQRIFIALVFLVFVVYIPTNIIIIKLKSQKK